MQLVSLVKEVFKVSLVILDLRDLLDKEETREQQE